MSQGTQRILYISTFGTVTLVIKYQFIRQSPTGVTVASEGIM